MDGRRRTDRTTRGVCFIFCRGAVFVFLFYSGNLCFTCCELLCLRFLCLFCPCLVLSCLSLFLSLSMSLSLSLCSSLSFSPSLSLSTPRFCVRHCFLEFISCFSTCHYLLATGIIIPSLGKPSTRFNHVFRSGITASSAPIGCSKHVRPTEQIVSQLGRR